MASMIKKTGETKMAIKIQEKDLFGPLKAYYENLGYEVEGEVKDCDLVVKVANEFMVVELKTDINFKVLLQAVNRQKMFDLVFIAVPIQKINLRSKAYQEKLHLLKRLGLGLMLVNLQTHQVQSVHPPIPADRNQYLRANKKRRERVVREFEQRILKNNVGGVNRQKISTYYRQQCYQIAYLLKNKPASAADLAKYGIDRQRIYSILHKNFYGWFEKVSRGVYGLSAEGQEVVEREKEMIADLVQEFSVGIISETKE